MLLIDTFCTDRLSAKRLCTEDYEELCRMHNDSRVMVTLGGLRPDDDDNILHCLRHGCQLGWLIEPDDRSILTFRPKQEPEVYRGSDRLQVLEGIELELTVDQVSKLLKI